MIYIDKFVYMHISCTSDSTTYRHILTNNTEHRQTKQLQQIN